MPLPSFAQQLLLDHVDKIYMDCTVPLFIVIGWCKCKGGLSLAMCRVSKRRNKVMEEKYLFCRPKETTDHIDKFALPMVENQCNHLPHI